MIQIQREREREREREGLPSFRIELSELDLVGCNGTSIVIINDESGAGRSLIY